MSQRRALAGWIGPLVLLVPAAGARAPQATDLARPVASLVPADTALFVDATGLGALLDEGLEHPLVRNLLASDLARDLRGDGIAPAAALTIADAFLGEPLLDTLAVLTRRGLGLAVRPAGAGSDGPSVAVLLHGAEAARSARALDVALGALGRRFAPDAPNAFARPHEERGGASLWRLGDDGLVARRGALVVVSNDEELVEDVLALAVEPKSRGLVADDAFRAAFLDRGGDAAVWAWADLAAWERANGRPLAGMRRAGSHPGAQALLGPGLATLGSARHATAALRLGTREASLEVRGTGIDTAPELRPESAGARRPPPASARSSDVAAAWLHRDYATLMRSRAELFAPERLPALARMMSQTSLFFGGRDVAEDVLPHVSPWLRLVVRPVAFEADRVPEIELPALVLLAELDEPEVVGPRFVSAFQTVVGVVNADRAQRDGRTLLLKLGLEGDVEVTSAQLLAPEPGDGVDMAYNLEPACAVVGSTLVIGTHAHAVRGLARELAREVGGEAAAPENVPAERVRLAPPRVADVLEANLETLVMQKVLDEGVRYAEARRELERLLLLLRGLASVELVVAYEAPDAVRATLDVELRAPGEPAR